MKHFLPSLDLKNAAKATSCWVSSLYKFIFIFILFVCVCKYLRL